ncbi:MAG: hypothetical protein IJW17_12870, partial [Lentisphaeria bacterium]|nr:hypothetical protein [Lentisphaeria bacterium]
FDSEASLALASRFNHLDASITENAWRLTSTDTKKHSFYLDFQSESKNLNLSDYRAIAIRKVFERVKGGKPGHFRSCGVDGLPEVIETDEFHATARHPFEEIARTSVEMLLNFFSGTTPEISTRKIRPVLIPWKK